MSDIGFLSITELGKRYRNGSLTPLEVVRDGLAKLERLEPALNAFAAPMAAESLAQAERAGAELSAGQDLGPLHGIPVAIKDLIEVAGAPTAYGTKVRPPRMATQDATLVARLRAAGAVIFGKTNLLEYAYGVAHPEIGQTNNPHDPSRTAGGSSGGSAAAVAAGIVPLAVGTDTGGSIRIPAAYCGIVGLKPSYGLVPLDGVFPLSWRLDHAGPLTRSAQDAAHALAVLAGRMIPLDLREVDGLRIGIVREHFAPTPGNRGVHACINAALDLLKQKGAAIVEIGLPNLDRANSALVDILRPEASLIHRELLAENPGGYAAITRQKIEAGFRIAATDYVEALRFADVLRAEVEALFERVDVLISPSVPFVAPHEDPEMEDGSDNEMLSSGFTNVTGHPSISLPCGRTEGLPVGMQLTGPIGRDAELLSIARALEDVIRRQ